MGQDLARGEACRVAAHEHQRVGQEPAGQARQIHDLGNIGQIVERESHRVGPPGAQRTLVVPVLEDLQVEQPNLVAGVAQGRGDPLQPQRLEPEIDLGVHEAAGMNEQDLHGVDPGCGFLELWTSGPGRLSTRFTSSKSRRCPSSVKCTSPAMKYLRSAASAGSRKKGAKPSMKRTLREAAQARQCVTWMLSRLPASTLSGHG